MNRTVSAFLAMKGNSERVPEKNITNVGGFPLFYHIVNNLSKSKYVKDIVIDTDSITIAEMVKKYFSDVKIHMRSEHLLKDRSEIMNLLIEDNFERTECEHILQTHSTNPLISVETIDKSIEEYFDNLEDHDSLFTVTPQRKRYFFKDGRPINHDPEVMIKTQDLEPIYEENSCIYLFSKKVFYNAGKKRIGIVPYMFPIDPVEATDIDEKQELEYVRFIFGQMEKENGKS